MNYRHQNYVRVLNIIATVIWISINNLHENLVSALTFKNTMVVNNTHLYAVNWLNPSASLTQTTASWILKSCQVKFLENALTSMIIEVIKKKYLFVRPLQWKNARTISSASLILTKLQA